LSARKVSVSRLSRKGRGICPRQGGGETEHDVQVHDVTYKYVVQKSLALKKKKGKGNMGCSETRCRAVSWWGGWTMTERILQTGSETRKKNQDHPN